MPFMKTLPPADLTAFLVQLLNQPACPIEDAISRMNRQTALLHAARHYVIAARSFLEDYAALENLLERYPQTELPVAVSRFLEGGLS